VPILNWLRMAGMERNETFLLTFILTLAVAYGVVKFIEHPLTALRHRLFRAKA